MVRTKTGRITKRRAAHGYYWCYTHVRGEPEETLDIAIRIATMVAGKEDGRSGKTYVVAWTPQPSPAPAVFVLARDHPELAAIAMSTMYELTPEGDCIRHQPTAHLPLNALTGRRPTSWALAESRPSCNILLDRQARTSWERPAAIRRSWRPAGCSTSSPVSAPTAFT